MKPEIENIKAFVIHLERSRERRDNVARLMSSLPVPGQIVAAVDAQTLSVEEVDHVYRRYLHKPIYPFALSKNEIACFLSHRKVWGMIVEQGCDAGFVVEDDVLTGFDFAASFAFACEFVSERGFIRFPNRLREQGRVCAERGGRQIIVPCPVGLGQVASLISRNSAQRLLEVSQIFDRPVDVFLQMFWLTRLYPLVIFPSGISEISARLGGTTLHEKRSLGERIHHEIMRPLYRWRIRKISQNMIEDGS